MIVAVKSCWHDRNRGCHQIIRETWGKDVDVRFFLGGNNGGIWDMHDEVIVDSPDNLDGLPFKVHEMCKYLKDKTDYAFFCDTDTFLATKRLFACGYQKYDYAGKIDVIGKPGVPVTYVDCRGTTIKNCFPFASGGFGYFLSRKAMEVIAAQPPSPEDPSSWAEDLWVAQRLGPHIQAGEMTGYNIPNFVRNMSWHFIKRPYHGYEPYNGWQEKLYKENQ